MTFLEMAKIVDNIIGTQGEVVSIEVPGYHSLLAEHISYSWTTLQNLRKDWEFMRDFVTVTLHSSQSVYTPFDLFATATDVTVKDWRKDLILYNKEPLAIIPYDIYLLEDWTLTPGKPTKMTIHPTNGSIIFNIPDKAYNIDAHYYKKPQVLSLNTDVVGIPEEFVYALIFKACASLGMYLGIQEIFQDYTIKANQEIGALMRSKNPPKTVRVRGIV